MFEPLRVQSGVSAQSNECKGRILVVDDARFVRELLRLHLSSAGYEVLSAEDAIVAGQLLLEHTPQLLIVDVNMPYMSGIDFVKAVRADADFSDIPVVFLSSCDDVEEHTQGMPGVARLTKPVTAERLLEVVAGYLPPAAA